MRHFLLVATAGLAALALPAQNDRWSRECSVPGIFGTGVNDATVFRGEIVCVGEIGAGRGAFVDHVARFDGTQWHEFPGAFQQTAQYPYFEGVNCCTVFQNELVVGGHFTAVGSTTAWHVARWNGTSWSSFGGGLIGFGEVEALAVYQNELYAAGSFTTNSGIDGIAKWNGSAWVPVGGKVAFTNTWGVLALHVASDGTLWAGGAFSAIGSVQAANVARWNGSAWQPVGSGIPGGQIWDVTEWQGRMVVGGGFDLGNNVRGLAAWNGTAFVRIGNAPLDFLNGVGLALHPTATHLYVGGDFSLAGGTTTSALARYDGAQWESLGGVGGGAGFPIVNGFAEHAGRLVIAGRFDRVGSETGQRGLGCHNVATWAPSSAPNGEWRPVGSGLGTPGAIHDMVAWRGGYVVAGSGSIPRNTLTFFDGHSHRPVAEFDAPVSALTVWQGDLVVSGGFSYRDGQPTTRTVRFDGTSWTPMGNVLASDFAEFQNELHASVGGIARWTGATWQLVGFQIADSYDLAVFGNRLYLAGLRSYFQTDGLFEYDGTTMRSVPNGPTARAQALLVRGSELYVGGEFLACGTKSVTRLARFDGTTWSQVGAGVAGPQGTSVFTLAELEGRLYLGGSFNTQGGFAADYVASFDGVAFRPLGSGLNSVVRRIVPEVSTGRLWMTGAFTAAAGTPSTGGVPSFGLACYRTRDAWSDLGYALEGSLGAARLTGHGTVQLGQPFGWWLAGAPALAPGVHVLAARRVDLPLLGGTLVPAPDATLAFVTSQLGTHELGAVLTSALPFGTPLFVQSWYVDAALPRGVSASNAITTTSR